MTTTLSRPIEGQAAHAAQAAGEHAAQGTPDLGGMIMHHLMDSRELELPWGAIHLPAGWRVDLGLLGTVDLAPTKHVVFMLLASALLLAIFLPLAVAARRRGGTAAPGRAGNAMEAMVLYFRDEVVRRSIGHGADAFAPLILTLFFFILALNLLGLLPWGSSATGNIAVTAALSLVSFVVIEVSGMRSLGALGYARTIFYAPSGMNPVATALMLLIMTPVELLGKFTKPFALTIRLFANMTGGHTLLLALGGLIFLFLSAPMVAAGVALGSTLVATGVMVLEVFVAFLQAYIFAMLTAVFIGLIKHAH